ncbi:MAG: DUF108 domain-containing protein [Candidatus Omnitrophica bacterium]|nr:DUF108 domain-containing protein [Candidatus Omnitrophota bacterium]
MSKKREKSKKYVAIIGCGVIGGALAEHADKKLGEYVSKIFLYDKCVEKSEILSKKLSKAYVCDSLEDAIQKADLIVEASVPKVVPIILKQAVNKNKDVMIMSVGGVLGCTKLLEKAEKKKIRILIPSGAISGIDGMKSAKLAGITAVSITTRKPVMSIKGAPYLEKKGIELDKIKEETVIFDGNACEAIEAFPANINVSAILSLAGIGPKKTKVKIIISPEYTKNVHEICIESGAGKITTRTENVPSPDNPKTSYLAVLSAKAALDGYFANVRLGT